MKTCYLISFLFFASYAGGVDCYGQGSHGVIEGRVTHHGTGVSNAITIMFDGEIAKGRAATDSEGAYTIKPLSPGRYTLKVFHADFDTLHVTDVLIMPDNTTIINLALNVKSTKLDGKTIIKYAPPLVTPGCKLSPIKTYTSDELEKMRTRDNSNIASTSCNGLPPYDRTNINIGDIKSIRTLSIIDSVRTIDSNYDNER